MEESGSWCDHCKNRGFTKSTCRGCMYLQKVCDRCGKNGHIVEDCRRKQCAYCHKLGHLQEKCRKLQHDSKVCGYCGKVGHEELECHRREHDSKQCSRCDRKGHLVGECKVPQCTHCLKLGHMDSACNLKRELLSISCDACGGSGHVESYCPNTEGCNHAKNIKGLCNSNFKASYDFHKNASFSVNNLQSVVFKWLKYRKVPEALEIAQKFDGEVATCLNLWTHTHLHLSYAPLRGSGGGEASQKPVRFYRFLNMELQSDSQNAMQFVAYLVRFFNTKLVPQEITVMPARMRTLYRGSHIPLKHLQGFFMKAVMPAGGFFRFQAFLATSPDLRTAASFLANTFVATEEKSVNVIFKIEMPHTMYHGTDISQYSEYEKEGEFLFPPYSLFAIDQATITRALRQSLSLRTDGLVDIVIPLEAKASNLGNLCAPVFHWT